MADPASRLTVKLRDARTTPAITRIFHLPVSRLILTSAYFRDHLQAPLTRHRDGIFRLNFPDFALFAIYAEWLSSGDIFSKAGLVSLDSPAKTAKGTIVKTPEEKARAAYTDYLGAWFLGSWLQDSVFKDSLISLMAEKMNGAEGYPREFVKALTPSLVDILCEGSKEGQPIRCFMYEAVRKFGTREDVEGFVPNEGKEMWPRAFVRGLLGYIHGMQARRVEDYEVGTGDEGEDKMTEEGTVTDATEIKSESQYTLTSTSTSDFTTYTTTTASEKPSSFLRPLEQMWTPTSHVSWPCTAPASKPPTPGSTPQLSECTATSVYETCMSDFRTEYKHIVRPKPPDEQCVFHEHTYNGGTCHRNMTKQN